MKNNYFKILLVLLLGVSLTAFGQIQLPEIADKVINTEDIDENDCSPMVMDYLAGYTTQAGLYDGSPDVIYAEGSYAYTHTPQPGTEFQIGNTLVEITLKKFVKSTSFPYLPYWKTVDYESFTMTVVDNTPPTKVSEPYMDAIPALEDKCYANMPNLVNGDLTSFFTDNSMSCTGSISIVAQSPLAGTQLPIGNNPITITIRDNPGGNEITETFNLVVFDNQGPKMTLIKPQEIGIYLGEDCSVQMPDVTELVLINSEDACSGLGNVTQIPAIGTPIFSGDNTVMVTVDDGVGNPTSQKFIMTVVDRTVPVITLIHYGPFYVNESEVRVYWDNVAEVSDNCKYTKTDIRKKGESHGSHFVTFDCCELGENIVTITTTDMEGNSTSMDATVLIYDNIAPTFDYNNEESIVLETTDTDDMCEALLPNLRGLVKSSIRDNCEECSPADYKLIQQFSIDGGDTWSKWVLGTLLYDADDNKVGFLAKDKSGNTSDRLVIDINIKDVTGPVLAVKDITVELQEDGFAYVVFTDIWDRENSWDNCSYIAESNSYWNNEWHDWNYQFKFDCSYVGTTFAGEVKVRDWAGNESNIAITNITIVDVIKPWVELKNRFTVKLDEFGENTLTLENLFPRSPSFPNGDILLHSGDNDGCEENVLDIEMLNPMTDTWVKSIDFTCAEVSSDPYSIHVRVTDRSGNVGTHYVYETVRYTVMVYVKDKVDPIAMGQDVVKQIKPNGKVWLNVMELENGSTDNCSTELRYKIKSVDGNPTDIEHPLYGGVQNYLFSTCGDDDCCEGLGVHAVELLVIDESGNTNTTVVEVRILEHIIARAFKTRTFNIPRGGLETLSAMDINKGSTDCLGDNIYKIYRVDGMVDEEPSSTDLLTLTCDDFQWDEEGNPIGLEVMLRVQENHPDGEVDYAACTVFFKDRFAPKARSVEVYDLYLDENNMASLTPDDIDDGSSDNSGCITKYIYFESDGQVMSSSIDFTQVMIGQTLEVVLKVVDKVGKTSYSYTSVNVYGNTDPALTAGALEMAEFTVYPNPTTDMLFISNPFETSMHVQLFNLTGKLLQEKHSVESMIELDMKRHDKGLYFVQFISDNNKIVTKKIIKK